ncbi:MAG: hypothetical protein HYZ14_01550 [Bacteroidetes bacterium]|nr:hypothetical protein [Bacteroidota bacterium]
MKINGIVIFSLLMFCFLIGCTENLQSDTSGWKLVERKELPDSLKPFLTEEDTLNFHLIYCFAGMGANFGTRKQYFEVKDSMFVFSMKQNSSFEGQAPLPTDTLNTGYFRNTTKDSVLQIIQGLEDSIITKRNLEVSSGGIVTLTLNYDGHKTLFSLHNCYDDRAQQLVELLNTYIPGNQKLFIYDFPAKEYGIDF